MQSDTTELIETIIQSVIANLEVAGLASLMVTLKNVTKINRLESDKLVRFILLSDASN